MNHIRIHGNPFGDDPAASLLRSFLRLALGNSMRCTLSFGALATSELRPGERAVALTDGVRDLQVGTMLPPAEIDLLLRAANEMVAATAPVVVFAGPDERADAVREAGLAWPNACVVMPTREGATAADLLERVRAELRWAGIENPPHALDERCVAGWLALPTVAQDGPIVWVGDDAFRGGLDLLLTALRTLPQERRLSMRFCVTGGDAEAAAVAAATHGLSHEVEVVAGALEPSHLRDAKFVVLPWRRMASSRTLVQALASGRPVVAARFAAAAALLDRPGTCFPVGGRAIADEPGQAAHFAPHPAALAAAVAAATALAPAAASALGRRARTFVVEELVRGRPASPPPPVRASGARRPVVVLEAPLFETSSSAELTLATAQALVERGNVDVRLVPTSPFRQRVGELRARAPELEPLLCRQPGDVDLWLSSGWPVRASRPACRTFALRIDQEYGTLPVELTPHVTQDADVVVVHSEHVFRTLMAAGRPMAGIKLIPHGVDAAMHDNALPDPEIVAWKGTRPAVLFCGGLIWRKGFDLFVQGLLAARARGADFCVVVKSVGQDQHYANFHLRGLLDKFRTTKGTPPVLLVDEDCSRERLASIYTACDLMLHPYRGEGFGLPVLEARACGLPVLATGGGATDSMMVGPGARKIPAARRTIELPAPHVALPWVLEPSGAAVGELLTQALRELPTLRREAKAFAATVRTAFPWSSSAALVEQLAFAAVGNRRDAMPPSEPIVALPQREPRRPAPVPSTIG